MGELGGKVCVCVCASSEFFRWLVLRSVCGGIGGRGSLREGNRHPKGGGVRLEKFSGGSWWSFGGLRGCSEGT